ncbi:hypothetical protein C2G38_2213538 [Gigaspora rosea]|uniref:Uncharacterized protein n=1 Tax=Gigaspora rosea TaxID=44941 RepID=A0A397UEX4_9GLOM|nr:hypothetical protein C2G38_2213538 [Gigaspora rosea]
MKFNLFLLFLTILAVAAFAYPKLNHDLAKRQTPSQNPNCDPNKCCNAGDVACFNLCGLKSCTPTQNPACDPNKCCKPGDGECFKACGLAACDPATNATPTQAASPAKTAV